MLIEDLIKQFKKIWPWLLAGTLILGIVGILWGSFFVLPFKSSLSIDVVRSGTQKVQEYKYDGYYAILAADEFSKSIQFWLKSPRLISDIFESAGISSEDLPFSAKFFKIKKLSPQYLEVEYSTENEKQSVKIAKALESVLAKKVEDISEHSRQNVSFIISVQEPLVWNAKKSNVLNSFALGLFLGVICSLLAVFLSIKPKK